MIAGGNWWRANEIVIRHLTLRAETRYRCRDKARLRPTTCGTAWQRMPPARRCAALEKGREALIAAQAERERLRQIEELRKAQELKHTLRPRGPTLGM